MRVQKATYEQFDHSDERQSMSFIESKINCNFDCSVYLKLWGGKSVFITRRLTAQSEV